jgi:hypothetical protein
MKTIDRLKVGDKVRVDRLYVVRTNPSCKGPPYKVGDIRTITKFEYDCKAELDNLPFPAFTWQLSKVVSEV